MDSIASGCLIGIVLIVIIVIVMSYFSSNAEEVLEAAEARYHALLNELKGDPSNADLYQRTLLAGRTYSNLTRDNKGVTIYDEMALSNDLNAARASVGQTAPTTTQAPASIQERISQLESLKSQGIITDQEYADKRAQILQSL